MAGSEETGKGARGRPRGPATKPAEGLRAFLYDAKAKEKANASQA